MTRALAVQKAVYDALVAGLSVPVFDHVPQGQAAPFVALSAQDVADRDIYASRGWLHVLSLNVWSQHRGQKQVLDILAEIDAALHDVSLSLDTGEAVLARVADARSVLDADGMTYRGAVTLRVMTI